MYSRRAAGGISGLNVCQRASSHSGCARFAALGGRRAGSTLPRACAQAAQVLVNLVKLKERAK